MSINSSLFTFVYSDELNVEVGVRFYDTATDILNRPM